MGSYAYALLERKQFLPIEAGEKDNKIVIAMVAKSLMMYHHIRVKNTGSLLVLLFVVALLLIPSFIGIGGNASKGKRLPTPSTTVAYGVNVDMTAMIPGTPYTITTANGGNFFDLATQLGINTLRITDFQWASTGEQYSRATWRYVFDEAEHHHIQIILLLLDGKGHTAIEKAHTLLDQYGLAQSPALWMVDLYNEPDLSNPELLAQLQEDAAYVHQTAPKVPITIGGWKSELPGNPEKFDWQDPADIPMLIDLVDVVSPHLYGFEQGAQQGFTPQHWLQNFLSDVRQNAQGKPVLLEEFGASNGLAATNRPTPTGSPNWQAYVYRSVLQEVSAERDQGVIGAIAWIIAPRPAWSSSNPGNMTGWAFVLNRGQHLLPAAQEFSAVAHAQQQETVH